MHKPLIIRPNSFLGSEKSFLCFQLIIITQYAQNQPLKIFYEGIGLTSLYNKSVGLTSMVPRIPSRCIVYVFFLPTFLQFGAYRIGFKTNKRLVNEC